MDFAGLMSKEISKGRQTSSPSAPSEQTKQYLKRAQVEAQRQEAYLQEQAKIQHEREEKLTQKRKRDEEDAIRTLARDEKRRRLAEESKMRREEEEAKKERARRKRLGLPDLPSPTEEDPSVSREAIEDIPDEELLGKLRGLNVPAVLFGETHTTRLGRYIKLTAPVNVQPTQTTGPIPTTLSLVPETEMKVPSTIPADPETLKLVYRQLASYFTMLLREWRIALQHRPDSVKESAQGKQAENTMHQTLANMRPLFRKMETFSLEEGILEPVVDIVRAAQERRYVDANDGYLRLSIGKAAWPIGVTMVGIHERSAREKLHESDKGAAHIMSDEVTRKFLQSIKRCLSFAQTRWPPEDLMQLMG